MDTSLLTLDLHRDSAHPKHEQLRQYFLNEMLAGRLKPGHAIPTEQHLVETLGVARTTVRQAMASLESDGLIRRTRGKGTFVESDAGRKLKRGHDIFALVVPETGIGFYPSLLRGFEKGASDIHHQAMICSTGNNVERQGNLILQLLDHEVGGVALNPTTVSPTPPFQVRQLQNHGIPVVFCHRRVEGVAAPLLAIPFHEVGRLAGAVLAEHGHRRAVYFTSRRSPDHIVRDVSRGLHEGIQPDHGESGDGNVMFQEDVDVAALQHVFARPDGPTAIFASFDSLAEWIWLLLLRAGFRVPEDVSLMGFGGTWRESSIARQLTSVVVDEAAIGQKAVALLSQMRRGERDMLDDQEHVFSLDVYHGETLGPPSVTSNESK